MFGNAFFNLFFISLLPIPLLERSSNLRHLFVFKMPTITSTDFSVSLFPCKSTVSICVSHNALTIYPILSSVKRFLAKLRFLKWQPFRFFTMSAAWMSLRSKYYLLMLIVTFIWEIKLASWLLKYLREIQLFLVYIWQN